MENQELNITADNAVRSKTTNVVKNSKVGKKPRSRANQKRDAERRDQHREKAGEREMDNLAKELDKRLFFGFASEFKAAALQYVEVSDQAKVVPVSTRAIGFYAQSIFVKLYQTLRNIPLCSVYQLYRVSLAQFEMRLKNVQHNQTSPYAADNADFRRLRLTNAQEEIIRACAVNFGPISSIINAVGTVQYAGTKWYPKLPQDDLMPHTITFSSLARVVNALADRNTPVEQRLHFYNNCPLPGAIWGPHLAAGQRRRADAEHPAGWPLLLNPHDFWPEEYGNGNLFADCNAVRNIMSFCSRKGVKYVDSNSVLSFESDVAGSPALLVSNTMAGLRNPEAVYLDGQIAYAMMDFPIGDLESFWCHERVDNQTGFMGALALLGEIPVNGGPEVYATRYLGNSRVRFDHTWLSLIGNMLA